jgi:ElaB/YqjD/DUF883 family membrane-anchored ribosome-binding protein
MPERRLVSADADDATNEDKLSDDELPEPRGDAALDGARAEIARTRDEVALSVVALQRELAETTDWRTWVARKPVLSVALAFGVGFAIGHRGHRS